MLALWDGIAHDQDLHDLENFDNDFLLARVKRCLDWDDQLRDNWEDFLPTA